MPAYPADGPNGYCCPQSENLLVLADLSLPEQVHSGAIRNDVRHW